MYFNEPQFVPFSSDDAGQTTIARPSRQFGYYGAFAEPATYPTLVPRCASLMITVPGTLKELEAVVKKWIGTCVLSRTQVGGRPIHREEALVANNPSLVNLWQTLLQKMPGQTVKLLAEYSWKGGGVESISFSIPVTKIDMAPETIVVKPPLPPWEDFVRKALNTLKNQKQLGKTLTPDQTRRLACLLRGLLDPKFDPRFVNFWDLNAFQKSRLDPNWDRIIANAREWMEFWRKQAFDDRALLSALENMDLSIVKATKWLNMQYQNLQSAMDPAMVKIKDWIISQQQRPNNLYSCYHN